MFAHYADNGPRGVEIVRTICDPPAQWILAGKNSPDERFIHHHRFRTKKAGFAGPGVPDEIMRVENAAAFERDSQGAEELRANDCVVDNRPVGERHQRPPHHANAPGLIKILVAQGNILR